MPYSYDYFKKEIQQHFKSHVSRDIKILDVGPGAATYSKLLIPLGYKLDCVEVWEPYIHEFMFPDHYEKVILNNIISFDFTEYDYMIMGDVLEHLTVKDATNLLKEIDEKGIKCLVAVPFLYEQGSSEGNNYETHLQPDLTPEIVHQRYKNLFLLFGNDSYAYYTNYYKWSVTDRVKYKFSKLLERVYNKMHSLMK